MKKKVSTRDLVERIAKVARERIAAGPVVALDKVKDGLARKTPPTLLVIEDDISVRRSLERLFVGAGYRVLSAGDVTELTEVLYDTFIDLIILDVGLPWINGYELATMMKDHKDLKSVPLIFLSGHADQEAIKKGFGVGAHDYITKPFQVDKVLKTIETLLKLNE